MIPDGGMPRLDSGCVFWAACVGGVCTALPGKGGACSLPDGGNLANACRAGTCINGTCQMIYETCTIARAFSPDAGTRD